MVNSAPTSLVWRSQVQADARRAKKEGKPSGQRWILFSYLALITCVLVVLGLVTFVERRHSKPKGAVSGGGGGFLGASTTEEIALPLTEETLKGCLFELVQVDDRELPDTENATSYWGTTAVLNHAYAARFGYRYRLVRVKKSGPIYDEYAPEWLKMFYASYRLHELRESREGRNKCTWLLFMDSDAFVREFDLPLPVFLAGLASSYGIRADASAIFTWEQSIAQHFDAAHGGRLISTGVFLVHADTRSRLLFDTMQDAAKQAGTLKKEFPYEQGIFTELVHPGGYPAGRTILSSQPNASEIGKAINFVNMTEMNSPWGRFVQHIWRGQGETLRKMFYHDALVRIDAAEPARFGQLLKQVRKEIVRWTPGQPLF
eukprot:gnl/TRDRNA2_/TRDRNA2_136655_c0_seq1.p1 gnl/TRDRNA2_/TRDRNA2_136655_c0~~gnl/TRDRNA2_/TRDRNA2_136655_c0_seq1.p1  ORF type:complete len:374 (-),score=54.99 gnl/TRDRNA2_/TRDRNA2_136655_c0_seq1:136-1257(-)